jgi:hypothetical protein
VLQTEARAVQSQVAGMIHHPLNGVLPLLLVPLITIVVKSLKKSNATRPPGQQPPQSRNNHGDGT